MYGHESREGHILHERPYGFEFRAVGQTLTNLDHWKGLVFGSFQQQFAVIESGDGLPSHDAALPQPVSGMFCDYIVASGHECSNLLENPHAAIIPASYATVQTMTGVALRV